MAESRMVLRHCEEIDPGEISTYLKRGGFEAWQKARMMTADEVISEVKASRLRGRGGAGFPCGLKWELARKAPGDEKFLICNADEGEVGTFKDRYIIENDPFSLVEGIGIAAYAIGAKKAYIYLRQEYQYLHSKMKAAIEQAAEKGFLENLTIKIQEGAGAYICGEETALMNSIEGRRGESRFRPPFPPDSGLFSQPTIINNVETLLNIPLIISKGGGRFAETGTGESTGTKVFSVSGDVEKPGVYELVMGCRLSELVSELAGAKDVKMVQVGGGAGGILPASLMDTPLSFETVLGSGAILVFNSTRDVIGMVYRAMAFLNEESCGKCAPCREGTEAMLEILERLNSGEGVQEDIRRLEALSDAMRLASLCGLGQSAAIPVLDTLRHFRNDYENRVSQSMFLRALQGLK